ncbi:hypothetical protein [Bacteroides stercorirosoris]|uniref:NVEALA protein n=1 Tax=Bacteroides stercorirosoris TaxID=871324 RepID=A0A1M6A715_9BACE|nr:hypothetical protein [Bacteroides stercorirosoris]SHI32219.1 hypothetical protein SAMN05444350_10185 [Bacteroides stercorirosoris]
MKKNLKLIVFTVVLCAVSALNVKVVLDTEHSSDLAMTSLAAIGEGGSGEGGSGEGGNDQTPCHTFTVGDVSMQDCRGIKMYARVTITYTCEGKKLGSCSDGVEYYFYDCEGSMIKHDEYITPKSCGQ